MASGGSSTRGRNAAVTTRGGLETVIRPRLLGRTPHDFHSTAARNLIRAGVPQYVVMQLRGWKTDATFRHYAIVDERDLRSAVEMLARGTIAGQEDAGGGVMRGLSCCGAQCPRRDSNSHGVAPGGF